MRGIEQDIERGGNKNAGNAELRRVHLSGPFRSECAISGSSEPIPWKQSKSTFSTVVLGILDPIQRAVYLRFVHRPPTSESHDVGRNTFAYLETSQAY